MKQQDLTDVSETQNLQLANEEFWISRLINHSRIPDPYQGLEGMTVDDGTKEYGYTFTTEQGGKLRKLCGDDDINVYSFLLSGISLLLSEFTDVAPFLLLTPDFEDSKDQSPLFLEIGDVGSKERFFKDFLMENRQKVIEAIKHQTYQYANVSAKLKRCKILLLPTSANS